MKSISISENDRGMVYFWDHELESSYSGAKNLALLSNSFSNFLALLEPEEKIFNQGILNMQIEQSLEPISKETFLSLEKKFNFTFPSDYKSFLLKHNGGIPSHQYFSTMDGKIEEILSRFFPVSSNDEDSLVNEIEGITLAGQLPSDLIPIAITLGEDDRVVLAISGENYGKVFHWAWSEESDNHNPSYDYVRLVANSFDSFLEKLTEDR